MGHALDLIVIASVLLALPIMCLTSSDPMTSLCDAICWEEDALSEQCFEDRCSMLRPRSRAHRKCEDACWEMVTRCRRMCSEHTLNVLSRCEGRCGRREGRGDAEDCRWDCFTHTMMTIKARLLPRDYLNHKYPN